MLAAALLALTLCPSTHVHAELPPGNPAERTASKGVDWPTFLGPTGDGKSTETGIRRDWSGDKLPVLWQRALEESYGIGSTAAGRLYQPDRRGDKAGLVCMNARTGKDIWAFEYRTEYVDMYGYNGGPRCSPVIDGQRVYLFGVEGILHCLDAATGRVIWKVDTAGRFGVVQNFFGVGSTPVVDQNLLLVMVGGSPRESHDLPRGRLDQVVGNGSEADGAGGLPGE
jgi:outer membrane protein assembly factor BamB